jgi:hypothetical protein
MLTVVDCPSCGRRLNLPEEARGKPVKCPGCGNQFAAPAPEAQPVGSVPLAPQPLDEERPPAIPGLPPPPRPLRAVLLSADEGPPPPRPGDDEERCPFCRARCPEGALRCPVCETELKQRASRRNEPAEEDLPPRRDYEPHRGALISSFGTLSILFGAPGLCGVLAWPFALGGLVGLGLGIGAVTMARADLEQMDRNIMDPEGRRSTVTGQGNGVVGLVLGAIGLFLGAVRLLVSFYD